MPQKPRRDCRTLNWVVVRTCAPAHEHGAEEEQSSKVLPALRGLSSPPCVSSHALCPLPHGLWPEPFSWPPCSSLPPIHLTAFAVRVLGHSPVMALPSQSFTNSPYFEKIVFYYSQSATLPHPQGNLHIPSSCTSHTSPGEEAGKRKKR